MEFYSSDEQQAEAIRKWWRDNGTILISGVLIGLALLFGGKAWLQYRHNIEEQASNAYMAMNADFASDRGDQGVAQGEAVVRDYSSTPYAVLTSLALARWQIDHGKLAEAQGHLEWALAHAEMTGMKDVVRLRLARLLLAQKKPEQAAATLKDAKPAAAFASQYDALRGDILMAQGKEAAARAAYEQALADTPANAPARVLLEDKLDNTGGPAAVPAAPVAEPKS